MEKGPISAHLTNVNSRAAWKQPKQNSGEKKFVLQKKKTSRNLKKGRKKVTRNFVFPTVFFWSTEKVGVLERTWSTESETKEEKEEQMGNGSPMPPPSPPQIRRLLCEI